MNVEEKAKAYDEALEKIRPLYEQAKKDGNPIWSTYEYLIPELRESEDERIRKALICGLSEGLSEHNWQGFGGATIDECLAYLEKQKEQNPISQEDFDTAKHEALWEEQKPELVQHPPITYMYPAGASRDERLKRAILALLNSDLIKVVGKEFTKQDLIDWVEQKSNIELIQRSWYMEGYHDRDFGMEPRWIIKTGEGGPKHELNPKYGQPLVDEPKPAWSEEDEKMLNEVLDRVTYAFYDQGNEGEIEDDPAFLWLHRLRPSWKPSEEQLNALNFAITYFMHETNYKNPTELRDLYEQLKKL